MNNRVLYVVFCFLIASFNLWSSETHILFLGDSLTAGYGIEKEKAFPELIKNKFQGDNLAVKITNAGISGSTSASTHSRLKWFLKAKPQILLLAIGANDGLRGLDLSKLEKNLIKTIELAKQNDIEVILAGMKIPQNYGVEYTKKFEMIYPQIAKKFNVKLIPFLLKDVATIKELNLPDRIHPNEKGHQKIAENIYPMIKELIVD